MKKLFILSLFFTISISAQGLKFSGQEQLEQVDLYNFDEKGYTQSIPNSYSLAKYVPPISKQQGGSCVGFATLYYGLSTMYNIQSGRTSATDKLALSFDPYFVYSLINNNSSNCKKGLYMSDAMNALSKAGSKKLFYPRYLSCNSTWTKSEFGKTLPYTSPYKLKNYYRMNPARATFIRDVKEVLYNKIPVIVGAQITKSMSSSTLKNNFSGISSNGLWEPKSEEKVIGGHAMCVIGYDDNKYGGAFRLANSWGKKFGDNGFLWIRYSDFKKYVKEAYFMEIQSFASSNYGKFTFKDQRFKGHSYEGQVSNGQMNGYGIYSFGNRSYIVGNFVNGSREGWFMYINENNTKLIKMIRYQNNKVVESRSLGFTAKENKEVAEVKDFFKEIMPNTNIVLVDEEPDMKVATELKIN